MKLYISYAFLLASKVVEAFHSPFLSSVSSSRGLKSMADDIGIPCEDECSLDCYPGLPESIHPGVLSGKAMMDLLDHAKQNGEFCFI